MEFKFNKTEEGKFVMEWAFDESWQVCRDVFLLKLTYEERLKRLSETKEMAKEEGDWNIEELEESENTILKTESIAKELNLLHLALMDKDGVYNSVEIYNEKEREKIKAEEEFWENLDELETE